jgi:hypothetical protein
MVIMPTVTGMEVRTDSVVVVAAAAAVFLFFYFFHSHPSVIDRKKKTPNFCLLFLSFLTR